MSKLPFVVEPKPVTTVRVGNDEVGILEIKKLNDLSPNERRWIREETKNLPDIRKEIIKLAQAIATKTEEPLLDVYDALANFFNYGKGAEALTLDADDLEQVIKLQDSMGLTSEQRQVVYATAITKFRLDADWSIEDTGNADLVHPELAAAIAAFGFQEEAHWPQPAEETEEEAPPELTEEDLGKS